jgi:hypothetical protein
MTLYFRSPDAIFSEIEGEFVALNIDRGQCYGMDSIASKVWSLLAEPSSLEAICAALESTYDVDPDTCRADVASLLASLANEGLVGVH